MTLKNVNTWTVLKMWWKLIPQGGGSDTEGSATIGRCPRRWGLLQEVKGCGTKGACGLMTMNEVLYVRRGKVVECFEGKNESLVDYPLWNWYQWSDCRIGVICSWCIGIHYQAEWLSYSFTVMLEGASSISNKAISKFVATVTAMSVAKGVLFKAKWLRNPAVAASSDIAWEKNNDNHSGHHSSNT